MKGYPAVFVDDILVAAPREFGYFGEVEGSGRYAPWRNEANQAKFKSDLVRMIDLILAGRKDIVSSEHTAPLTVSSELTLLPALKLTDLSGRPLTKDHLANRVVLVEFWATWCPPCRATLEWLGELKRQHGDKIAILALAVESLRTKSAPPSLNPDLHWAINDAPTALSFGDITSVPPCSYSITPAKPPAFSTAPPTSDQVERH